jgi:Arc/MetJ-type ribon-helix-helix transcriptional regulator
MTIHLPESLDFSIRDAVRNGRFASVDDAMAEAARLLLRQLEQGSQSISPSGRAAPAAYKPIWEEIAEITADVPEEAWDALPTDLSDQHDHYIYGTPKRTDA